MMFCYSLKSEFYSEELLLVMLSLLVLDKRNKDIFQTTKHLTQNRFLRNSMYLFHVCLKYRKYVSNTHILC